MFWLLLVVHMGPLPAENAGEDNPNRDTSMLLQFREHVTTVEGVYPTLAACQQEVGQVSSRLTPAFCVEAH